MAGQSKLVTKLNNCPEVSGTSFRLDCIWPQLIEDFVSSDSKYTFLTRTKLTMKMIMYGIIKP